MTKEEKYKLLYDRYTKCRDLELDRFWKNSVFVWVFLALCYGAFGKIIIDYLPDDKDVKISQHTYEIILAVISFFGFFMSKIWIWMARGLKAWYEVYETAVWDLESKSNVFDFDRRYTIENYWSVKTNGFRLFNSDRISPSRIVILIGRLMSCTWCVSFLIWLFKCCNCTFFDTSRPVLSFWGIIIGCVVIMWICYCSVKTTTLRDKKEDIVYWKIKNYLYSKDSKEDNTIQSQQSAEQITTQPDTKSDDSKLSNIYLSVKDDKIEFFFKNVEEKSKYATDLTSYINQEFQDAEKNCLKDICKKIQNLFKDDIERDDILRFNNKKPKELIQTQQETNTEHQSTKS